MPSCRGEPAQATDPGSNQPAADGGERAAVAVGRGGRAAVRMLSNLHTTGSGEWGHGGQLHRTQLQGAQRVPLALSPWFCVKARPVWVCATLPQHVGFCETSVIPQQLFAGWAGTEVACPMCVASKPAPLLLGPLGQQPQVPLCSTAESSEHPCGLPSGSRSHTEMHSAFDKGTLHVTAQV